MPDTPTRLDPEPFDERETIHALFCNAFGYDTSIVRALALWARRVGDADIKELAERVLKAEEAARWMWPCDVVHPLPDEDAAEVAANAPSE